MIEAERAERFKNTMTGAAFVGWQLGQQSGSLKKELPFSKYLRLFGLSDDPPPLDPEQRKAVTARALATAKKISAAFKAKKAT